MPTPRMHGGAPLVHIPLNVPAFKGLNRQASASILGVEWATRLEESVIDENNRVAARKGWTNLTTTTVATEAFVRLFEYKQRNGTRILIASSATRLWASTTNGDTWANITGTIIPTDGGNWQFHNFNDKCVAVQDGHKPIVYTGAGNFTVVADVNAPMGGVGLSAFGRMWVVDDNGTSIAYSSLLNETDWTTADSGFLDLFNTWPGADACVALASFNGALIAFGTRNIVFFTDGQGSKLGLDPLNAYVADTFAGTGCMSKDSVQQVDGDLWFLSRSGLISLGRLINERSNPLENLSKNVQDFLRDAASAATDIESVYSPLDRFYLLSFKTGADTGATFVFDTRGKLDDGTARCAGVWYSLVPRALLRRESEHFLFTIPGQTGRVGRYTGQLQPGGPYQFVYESGWIDFDAGAHLKMLKRFGGIFYMDRTATVTFKWAYDFSENFITRPVVFSSEGGTVSEWGEAEWGLSEWAGGVALRENKVPGHGAGEYLKLGMDARIDNTTFAIQQAELFAKIGRLA